VSTLLLLGLGNLVTTTESGMGCGDSWPDCNGQWIPTLDNLHVVLEFGHRILAVIVTLFAVLATIGAWRVRDPAKRRSLRITSAIALGLLLLQIVLGALTVRLELPPNVVFVHLGVSMAFFGFMADIFFQTRSIPQASITHDENSPEDTKRRLHGYAKWIVGVVYLQILIGAYVRHSGAGLACPDVPLCQGQWIPPLYEASVVHLSHRLLGIAILILAISIIMFVQRRGVGGAMLMTTRWMFALVTTQIAFGVMSILTLLSPFWTSLHLMGAALIFAFGIQLISLTKPESMLNADAAGR
jgi:cytochrome c oxidase assembly protein subunit 15